MYSNINVKLKHKIYNIKLKHKTYNAKLKHKVYNVKIRYKVSIDVINNIISEFQSGILDW